MFCLNIHSRDSFDLCQSLFEVQVKTQKKSCPIRLHIWPHAASPHTPCREASFYVSQVLRHDNPKLDSKDDNHIMFWGVFWRNFSLAKFAWRKYKFAGEICLSELICRRNLSAKFVGKIFCNKKLVKPSLIFSKKPPKRNFTCELHLSQSCHRHIPRTLPSLRSAQRKQLRSRDFVCSRSAGWSTKYMA